MVTSQLKLLGPTSSNVSSTHESLYENNSHTTLKNPARSYLPYMGRKAQNLGTLTPNLLYKEKFYIQGILVSPTPLYKALGLSFLELCAISNSHIRVIRDSSIVDLTFEGSLACTLPMLSVGFLPFLFSNYR